MSSSSGHPKEVGKENNFMMSSVQSFSVCIQFMVSQLAHFMMLKSLLQLDLLLSKESICMLQELCAETGCMPAMQYRHINGSI